jgi:hypothetical protein
MARSVDMTRTELRDRIAVLVASDDWEPDVLAAAVLDLVTDGAEYRIAEALDQFIGHGPIRIADSAAAAFLAAFGDDDE